ncbi:MAG: tRNA (adenosine(37)-N6)-dimethylallyltransferase MiaA [Desulfovibrio sp.]|nr:tRNA (adenosine(37)-N6)-dimethylallyltransferase MiaA [Desulfovibrio sp.]
MQAVANKTYPVLCLAGPTGCGKTSLALALALSLPCEIINADSRQIYADFPLICAQPTKEEQAVCPHHLYGILPTTAKISAGEWRDRAIAVIEDVLMRRHVPLLVGGTGMYFHALLHGIAPIPPVHASLRAQFERRIEEEGVEALYEELTGIDPDFAAKIHPHDRQRITRGLEVFAQTGRTLSSWHEEKDSSKPQIVGPLFVVKATLEWLMPRCIKRIEKMCAEGAFTEVKNALKKCPDTSAPGWSGIGCAEVLAFCQGRLSREECLALWQDNTRAYAKRQNTWFRGRKEALFFAPDEKDVFITQAIETWHSLRQQYATRSLADKEGHCIETE